jgi:glycosyltransferase involved in cell wall biosynthesis
MARVTLLGRAPDGWRSVAATREFFRRTLERSHDVTSIATDRLPTGSVDVLVNFYAAAGWQRSCRPSCPRVLVLHGGAVLNGEFVRRNVRNLGSADYIVVNCTSDRDYLGSICGDRGPRIRILPLPVDTTTFAPMDRQEARRLLPALPHDGLVVLYVARLLPQKGLHYAIRSVARCARLLRRRVHLLVIGDWWTQYPVLRFAGNYEEHVVSLIRSSGMSDSVVFLPAGLTADALATCYAAADVVVVPTNSLDENFGYVALEAMACARPVLATAYGGLKDTVVHGGTGELLPTWASANGIRFDVGRSAERLAALLRCDSRAQELGAAGRARVLDRYVESRCAGILDAVVEDALRGSVEPAGQGWAQVRPAIQSSPGMIELPWTTDSWSGYRAAVEYYVSSEPPRLQETTHIEVAAPLRHTENRYRADDPAWPAAYALTGGERDVVERCRSRVSTRELRDGGVDLDVAQHLVDRGVLVAS